MMMDDDDDDLEMPVDVPDFSLFRRSQGLKVFEKVTGKSGERLTSWHGLKRALLIFGQGNDPRFEKLATKGLSGLGFFSSGEDMIAIAMLVTADRGDEAQKAANKIGFFRNWNRTADENTRALVGKLMSM